MNKTTVSIVLAAAACSGGAKDSVTLSARLGTASGQSLPVANGAAQVADGIELTRARISVRRLRVERKGAATEVEISQGPLLLDVGGDALSGALLQLVSANVPAGTYDRLKLDIHRVDAAPAGAFDDLVKQGASILLEGTIDDQPFTFASALEAELEHEGQFEIGSGASNITLTLDASRWFVAADGSRLDPRESSARGMIEANIRASISAFEDDDEDGVEDHGHDGSDDRGGADGGPDDGSGHH